MPRADQLPDDLKELAYRNCVEITHARWGTDLQVLIKGLDREINPDAKPPATWWKSRTAIFALLAIALVAAAVAAYSFRPKQASVPAATGGTAADAASKVEPPATVEVPTLLSMSLRTAEQTLRERRLKLGNVSRQPRSDVAKDIVLNEFPKAGERADVGSAIDLEVSAEAPSVPVESKKTSPPLVVERRDMSGQMMIEVPRLMGESLQAAEQTLWGSQLNVGNISRQPRSDVAKDTVLRQSPKPGEKLYLGNTVDLVISAGVAPVSKVSPTPVSVTISRATCAVAGFNGFLIQLAGRVTVPAGRKSLFYLELAGKGAARFQPRCQFWAAADPSDGALSNVSCVHKPNDPPETEWQLTTTVKGAPTSVYAGVISDQKKAGGATKPLTCAP